MSTYAIAGAIEKLAKVFEEVIREKNEIEMEKLEFEKEKFEFNKQQLQLNESLLNELSAEDDTSKECEHDWEVTNFEMTNDDFIFLHTCRKCKETKAVSMRHFIELVSQM